MQCNAELGIATQIRPDNLSDYNKYCSAFFNFDHINSCSAVLNSSDILSDFFLRHNTQKVDTLNFNFMPLQCMYVSDVQCKQKPYWELTCPCHDWGGGGGGGEGCREGYSSVPMVAIISSAPCGASPLKKNSQITS